MKVKHFLLLVLLGMALILAWAFIGRVNRPPGEAVVTETTETRVDTVTDEAPAPTPWPRANASTRCCGRRR